jgi:hypothetical protein
MSKSYGAFEGGDSAAAAPSSSDPHDESFDASESYYLKGAASSRTWTFKKCFLVSFPILVAAAIVGGAAFFLSRDFNRLYPGHGGSVERTGPAAVRTHGDKVLHPESSANGHAASEDDGSKSSVLGGMAACSSHPVCSKSGLLGDCCPTEEGIQLDCC